MAFLCDPVLIFYSPLSLGKYWQKWQNELGSQIDRKTGQVSCWKRITILLYSDLTPRVPNISMLRPYYEVSEMFFIQYKLFAFEDNLL